MCKWLHLTPKKKANQSASNNCQIWKCPFSSKFRLGKLGRISTENLSFMRAKVYNELVLEIRQTGNYTDFVNNYRVNFYLFLRTGFY